MKIPKRIASAVINSLKGGVVPRVGLPYIAVGREKEIEALLRDAEIIEEGGASFRFIVGKFGSGKAFWCRPSGTMLWTGALQWRTLTFPLKGGFRAPRGRGLPHTRS